jgi:TonB family protein
MLNYILQLTLVWGALYLLYMLLLQRTTFFAYNRLYLLGSLVLGAVLPLYDWGALLPHAETFEQAGYYLQPITIGVQQVEIVVTEQTAKPAATVESGFSWAQLLWWIYAAGAVLTAARLFYGGWQLRQLYRSGTKHKQAGYTLVKTPTVHTPFSFFRWLFWSEVLPCPSSDKDNILRHELAHITGGHSVDVLLLEVLSVLLWFHPLVYLYNRSLRTVHEYQADEAVLQHEKKKTYGHLLLRQSQTGQAVALANHFSHTQLKKRILMMTRKKSPRLQQLWYALALPLVAILAFAFAMPTEAPLSAADPLSLTVLEGDAETLPVFAGCEDAGDMDAQQSCTKQKLMAFMGQELKYPAAAKKAGKEGMVVVEFTVLAEGSVGDIKVLKSAGYGMDEAAVAVVEAMPRWTPGKDKSGKAVATKMTLPFQFKLPAAQGGEEVFKVAEEMPRFPGCEDETDASIREKCSQKKLLEFVYGNLTYPEEAKQAGISGTVIAQFVINNKGQVQSPKIVRSIGGGTDEAVLKVIRQMPDWVPGKQRGKAVSVQFNLPIRFQLPPETETAEEEDRVSAAGVFSVAEEMPRFPGCEDVADMRERELCAQKRMLEFVYSNVKYPKEASKENVQGVGVLKLVIGKMGKVERYEIARSIHPSLDAELDRIARLLQDEVVWVPGKQDGEAVSVALMLPIKFKLADKAESGASNLKLDSEGKPLFVIDGEARPGLASSGLDDILNPDDIASINVLKGESATEKYGKAGKDGVIEITTKNGTPKDALRVIGYGKTEQTEELNIPEGKALRLRNFQASPNPTDGELRLRFSAPAQPTVILLRDLNGRELLRQSMPQFQGNADETLDLSGLPSGMVVLEIRQGEQLFTEKVIVK